MTPQTPASAGTPTDSGRLDRELVRCQQEIAEIAARSPEGPHPAYLAVMGENDWRHEAKLIEQERQQARPLLTRAEMEARRLAAVRLFEAGTRQSEIGRLCGVTRTTVSRWAAMMADGGAEAMRRRAHLGRRPRLDWKAKADELRALYEAEYPRSRTALGFGLAIQRQFGVAYDPDHIARIKKALGIPAVKSRKAVAAGGEVEA